MLIRALILSTQVLWLWRNAIICKQYLLWIAEILVLLSQSTGATSTCCHKLSKINIGDVVEIKDAILLVALE